MLFLLYYCESSIAKSNIDIYPDDLRKCVWYTLAIFLLQPL